MKTTKRLQILPTLAILAVTCTACVHFSAKIQDNPESGRTTSISGTAVLAGMGSVQRLSGTIHGTNQTLSLAGLQGEIDGSNTLRTLEAVVGAAVSAAKRP